MLETKAETSSPAAAAALKVMRLLGALETYVCGESDIIIDYGTARWREEPTSAAVTESTVQWLAHRRMNAQQHAVDATRRAFDAQGSMRGDEWYPRTRPRRHRFETVSVRMSGQSGSIVRLWGKLGKLDQ